MVCCSIVDAAAEGASLVVRWFSFCWLYLIRLISSRFLHDAVGDDNSVDFDDDSRSRYSTAAVGWFPPHAVDDVDSVDFYDDSRSRSRSSTAVVRRSSVVVDHSAKQHLPLRSLPGVTLSVLSCRDWKDENNDIVVVE